MKRVINRDFINCGLTGWCIEVLFTSASCFKEKNYKLIGKTSVWMFPIYGMASVIKPISKKLKAYNKPMVERGAVYTAGIFLVEFVSGSLLKKSNNCPWDYSSAKYNIKGVVRLDYAPLWFVMGLIYEKILSKD